MYSKKTRFGVSLAWLPPRAARQPWQLVPPIGHVAECIANRERQIDDIYLGSRVCALVILSLLTVLMERYAGIGLGLLSSEKGGGPPDLH